MAPELLNTSQTSLIIKTFNINIFNVSMWIFHLILYITRLGLYHSLNCICCKRRILILRSNKWKFGNSSDCLSRHVHVKPPVSWWVEVLWPLWRVAVGCSLKLLFHGKETLAHKTNLLSMSKSEPSKNQLQVEILLLDERVHVKIQAIKSVTQVHVEDSHQ